MKKTVAQLLLILTVLSLASCSMEKRLYSNGYHFSWMHSVQRGVLQDASQDASQDAGQDVSQDASQDVSQDASQDVSQELSQNLSENLEFQTPSDTITPTTKDDDYFGQKETTLTKENKEPFFGHPIRKPKTVEQLKKAIGRDFKLVLLAMLLGGISGGLLALVGPSATSVGDGLVFLTVVFVLSIAGFIFYLVRGLLRILKLTVLKIFGKKDDAAINKKEKKHRLRESEHQYLRRFGLWFGNNLFSPIGRLKILGLLLLIAIPLLVIFNPH